MSQENVAVIRAIYDGWLADDPGYQRFDPEITMIESKALPGAVEAYGIDSVRRYMESFRRYWEKIRFEPQEYIDAGDRVVVIARLVGRGKSSGIPVERTWSYVWTLRDGRALRMDGFANRAQALQAAGLSE
jgi:ketosteroid isomerase-like protein